MARIRVTVLMEAGEPINRIESEIESTGVIDDLHKVAERAVEQVAAAARSAEINKTGKGPGQDGGQKAAG